MAYVVVANLDELARLRREHERRWMTEIDEPEMTGGTYLAVQHSRDLSGASLQGCPQRIPSRDRLRQPEIDLFKQQVAGYRQTMQLALQMITV